MRDHFPLLDRYKRLFDPPQNTTLEDHGIGSLLSLAYKGANISLESYLLGVEALIKTNLDPTAKEHSLFQKILLALMHAEERGEIGFKISTSTTDSFELWLSSFAPRDSLAQTPPSTSKAIQELMTRLASKQLVGLIEDNPFIVFDNDILYFHMHFVANTIIKRAIDGRHDTEQFKDVSKEKIEALLNQRQFDSTLTEDQKRALFNSFQKSLSWISGGPGTGKTFLITYLARLFLDLKVLPERIKIAAPTGKSVDRINTSLSVMDDDLLSDSPKTSSKSQLVAQTLHKLLGYKKNSPIPSYHPKRLVAADVVIVDESTMIDHATFADLLQAISLKAHLVFVGDKDQLPSIRPGGLFQEQFNEFKNSNFIALKQNFRMNPDNPNGSQILEFAESLLAGKCKIESYATDSSAKEEGGVSWVDPLQLCLEDVFNAQLEKKSALEKSAAKRVLKLSAGQFSKDDCDFLENVFSTMKTFKILTPTNKGPLGTQAINHWYKKRHGQGEHSLFYPASPVIINENNYDLELWNGTEGLAMLVQRDNHLPKLEFIFQKKSHWQSIDVNTLQLTASPAHAITIHKSQGSEYEEVVVVLPPYNSATPQKQLLYTGCTRASRRLTVVSRKLDFYRYLNGNEL